MTANDEAILKKCVQAKVHASCSVNDNWPNASIRYGTPNALKFTPEYISAIGLQKEWTSYEVSRLKPDIYYPNDSVQAAHLQKSFSLIRTTHERHIELWVSLDTEKVPAQGLYAGLVPPGCWVHFLQVGVKYLVPREVLGQKGMPTADPAMSTSAPKNRRKIHQASPVPWMENRS